MSNTGVAVDPALVSLFNDFKLRNTLKFFTLKLNDANTEVVLDQQGDPSTTYADFLKVLPANDCRYAFCNVEYNTESDGQRQKIVFFLWAPDTARVKAKMLYAGTKDTVKKSFQGINVECQGTELAEVQLEAVIAKCQTVSK
eukprot:TRINITY_DN27759_c0_g1_i1.p2 TRINITY_DN27759_c0_g1~~TRINITY_DN27759_c0_g1_i1.p2  ORF type:complete len:142 (-),score=9.17 TRINITY_DN27759_c0_g1_i1:95-520(-)